MSGCTQPDGAVGSSVGTDLNGTTRVISVPIEADTSYIAETVSAGSSPYLYVGSAAGINSSGLISFRAPVLPFQWEIDSARISLSYQGSIGNGRGTEIKVDLLNISWDESDPPSWDTLSQNIEIDTLIGQISVEDDSNSVSMLVSPSHIEAWLSMVDSRRSDTGYTLPATMDTSLSVYLGEPTGGFAPIDQLVRFRSRGATDTLLKPQLMIFMSISDSLDGAVYSDTVKIYSSKDAYILKHDPIVPGENLIVGSGVNFRSNLRFDLSELWQAQDEFHIVVNRATVLLHKVAEVSNILPVLPSISPFRLTDSTGFTFPDSTAYSGFALFSTAIDTALDTLQIIVTTPASDWAVGPELNFGLSLHSSTQGLDINRSAYYSSSHPDPALRPSLSIYYTELLR